MGVLCDDYVDYLSYDGQVTKSHRVCGELREKLIIDAFCRQEHSRCGETTARVVRAIVRNPRFNKRPNRRALRPIPQATQERDEEARKRLSVLAQKFKSQAWGSAGKSTQELVEDGDRC